MKSTVIMLSLVFLIACDKSDITPPSTPNLDLINEYQWNILSSTPSDIRSFSKNDDIFFLTEDIGWVIGSGTGTVYKTTDGGETWNLLFKAPDYGHGNAYFRSIGFLTEQIGYVGVLYGKDSEYGTVMFETRDGGTSWHPIPALENSLMQGVCGISVVDSNTLVAGGRIGGSAYIALTSDQGQTWRVSNPQSNISMITDSYFWNADNGIVTGGYVPGYVDGMNSFDAYALSEMRIIRTRDGGLTWEDAYKSDRKAEWGWKFSFVNEKLGFASIQSFRGFGSGFPEWSEEHILRTKDGGESWKEIVITHNEGDFFSTQGIAFLNEKVGWIGSWRRDKPMRYTYDGGRTWYDSDYIGTVNRIRIVSDKVLYAVSHDILKVDLR